MPIKTKELPDIRGLKTEVIEVIVKNFGITKAAFFIRELMSQKANYLKIKERLFGGKTSVELYDDICKWKKG